MPRFTIEVDCEFEVYCGECGAGLCNNSSEGRNGHSNYIDVSPCENCLQIAYDEGREEGLEEGREEGEETGYNKGYNEGYEQLLSERG